MVADKNQLDFIGVNDHVVAPTDIKSTYPYSENGVWGGSATGECLDIMSVVSFLAAITSRIRLITSVLVAPHRPALLTAKMITSADVLSGGRLTIGLGTGWMQEELEALGAPPYRDRGNVTDEYIDVFRKVWKEERPSFKGHYCNFSPILFAPKPVQKFGPPIWIGGESPAAIKRTVQRGDGWYPASHNPRFMLDTAPKYRNASAKLKNIAESFGRDPNSLDLGYCFVRPINPIEQKSNGGRDILTGSTDTILNDIENFANAGVQTLICNIGGGDINEILDRITWLGQEIVPLIRDR